MPPARSPSSPAEEERVPRYRIPLIIRRPFDGYQVQIYHDPNLIWDGVSQEGVDVATSENDYESGIGARTELAYPGITVTIHRTRDDNTRIYASKSGYPERYPEIEGA